MANACSGSRRSARAVDDGRRWPVVACGRSPIERAGEARGRDGLDLDREGEIERRRAARARVAAIGSCPRGLLEARVGRRGGTRRSVGRGRPCRDERATSGPRARMALAGERGAEREDDELDGQQRERKRSARRAGARQAAVAVLHPYEIARANGAACVANRYDGRRAARMPARPSRPSAARR